MREIEIKAKVLDKAGVLQKLKELGVELSAVKKQHDVVFSEPSAQDNQFGANWLRIRTQDDKLILFTLKRSVVGHLDSIEHEVEVSSASELEEIIKLQGYEKYSDLTKIRQTGKHGDIELCVDEVPGLGTFIEAEKMMAHDSDHDLVVAELWGLFEKLGVSKTEEVHEGYDVLERRTRGL